MRGSLPIAQETVRRVVGRDRGMRRLLSVRYQQALYTSLSQVWPGSGLRVLDVGCGAGRVAGGYFDFLGVESVVGVDVARRFAADRRVPCAQFDGVALPFADGTFDVVTLVNVLHHVPVARRDALLAECARVSGSGPIVIKDHVVRHEGDHMRLTILDVIGNWPAGGMVSAEYLTEGDLHALFRRVEYTARATVSGTYRTGLWQQVFPNRLEQSFLFEHRSTQSVPAGESASRA